MCNQNCLFLNMHKDLQTLKGIHPGVVLERELKKRKLAKGRFAIDVGEYPQTLVAIIKGKRKMNVPLSLRIEKALGLEDGYFMILQTYYDIEQEKASHKKTLQTYPPVLRRVLFWDTDWDSIDWERQKKP